MASINEEYEKALADLEKRKAAQNQMKMVNAIIRSGKNVTERLQKEAGLSEKNAIAIQEKDFAGRIGFAQYNLTNNLANIRRLEDRVAQLKDKVSAVEGEKTAAQYTFERGPGGTIEENFDLDRVQIFFNGIPDAEIRGELKGSGWNWSPSNKAWQRKITPQAIHSATTILKATKQAGGLTEEAKENLIDTYRKYTLQDIEDRNFAYVSWNLYAWDKTPRTVENMDKKPSLASSFIVFADGGEAGRVREIVNKTFSETFPQIPLSTLKLSIYPRTYVREAKAYFKAGNYLPNAEPTNIVFKAVVPYYDALDETELEKGIEVEQEHKETFEKLAAGEISVEEAVVETAKEQIDENPEYYEKLEEIEGKSDKKAIRELGTGAKVYFENEFFRLNEFGKGGYLIVAHYNNNEGSDYVEIDDFDKAMSAVKDLSEKFPKGLNPNTDTLQQLIFTTGLQDNQTDAQAIAEQINAYLLHNKLKLPTDTKLSNKNNTVQLIWNEKWLTVTIDGKKSPIEPGILVTFYIGSETYSLKEVKKVFEKLRKFFEENKPTVEKTESPVTKEYKNQYELNKAIEALLEEKGDQASAYSVEEKVWLKKYSGYGGLDQYGTTGKGGLFEYYTPRNIIEKMWALAYKYGYNNGPVLEPSVATGEFFQFAKPGIELTGFEISKFSAAICKILYPQATIHLQPFEQHFIANNFTVKDKTDRLPKYDLVVGNPPYGDFSIVESRYMAMGEKKHVSPRNYVEYFIRRGVDLLNPNGLLIYIVGSQVKAGGIMFLDSGPSEVKEYLAKNTTLVDAYRLPDTVFERTGVTSDIIVLRKNP